MPLEAFEKPVGALLRGDRGGIVEVEGDGTDEGAAVVPARKAASSSGPVRREASGTPAHPSCDARGCCGEDGTVHRCRHMRSMLGRALGQPGWSCLTEELPCEACCRPTARTPAYDRVPPVAKPRSSSHPSQRRYALRTCPGQP
ncbi:hypothetical protein WR25_26023 [Diploscapter pachys]|uniref:Uncharacterized protein n=1 Tax=Diploscapter pachys TaxID=2018661 RepID=A0A2A2K4L4_9BILA|nr:hypothetical protein WR25_26023 [Diploscapter pachys]